MAQLDGTRHGSAPRQLAPCPGAGPGGKKAQEELKEQPKGCNLTAIS